MLGGGLGSVVIGPVPTGVPSTPSLIRTDGGGSVVLVRLVILSFDQPCWNSHQSLAPILPFIRKVFWVPPSVLSRLASEALVWDG